MLLDTLLLWLLLFLEEMDNVFLLGFKGMLYDWSIPNLGLDLERELHLELTKELLVLDWHRILFDFLNTFRLTFPCLCFYYLLELLSFLGEDILPDFFKSILFLIPIIRQELIVFYLLELFPILSESMLYLCLSPTFFKFVSYLLIVSIYSFLFLMILYSSLILKFIFYLSYSYYALIYFMLIELWYFYLLSLKFLSFYILFLINSS